MPDKLPPDDLRNVWQTQREESVDMSLEEIRRRADRFQKRISRRNLREFAACIIVVAAFGYFLHIPNVFIRVASALTIAGALYVMYYCDAWVRQKRAGGRALHRLSRFSPKRAGSAARSAEQRLEVVPGTVCSGPDRLYPGRSCRARPPSHERGHPWPCVCPRVLGGREAEFPGCTKAAGGDRLVGCCRPGLDVE